MIGAELDRAVGLALGIPPDMLRIQQVPRTDNHICTRVVASALGRLERYDPSTNWAVGGPIMDKVCACVGYAGGQWFAGANGHVMGTGPTALIAMCRAIVAAAEIDRMMLEDAVSHDVPPPGLLK